MTTMASRRCADCGTDISERRGNAKRCAGCVVAYKKAHLKARRATPEAKALQKAYHATPEAKARRKALRSTPEAKAIQKAIKKAYHATPEAKALQKARRSTPEALAHLKARRATPEVKAHVKAYLATPEVKARVKAYLATPEVKARVKAYGATPERKALQKARNVRMGGAKPHRWWPELAERQGGKCVLCGKALLLKSDAIHVDHIIPVSLGGPTELWNLQAVHRSCNLSKGNKIVPQTLVLV